MALPLMLLIELCLVHTVLSIAGSKGETQASDRFDTLVSISFGILTVAITQGIAYYLTDLSDSTSEAILAMLGVVPAIPVIVLLCRYAKNKLWYQRARLLTQTGFFIFWIIAIYAGANRPIFLYGIQFIVYAYITGGVLAIELLIALISRGRRLWHKRYAKKPQTTEAGGDHD